MKTTCPKHGELDTVLEVPVPEETFAAGRSQEARPISVLTELQLLLGILSAPLIPIPVKCNRVVNDNITAFSEEHSTAKYIVQQYISATGGESALNSVDSMYAVGKVSMAATEFESGFQAAKKNWKRKCSEEIGGFLLWQKRPDFWNFELIISGYKISAGSDGDSAWRQTPWQKSHASPGPPRPLRRSLQGLDPRATANLFSNSICFQEKKVNNEDCFVLKLEADAESLSLRSTGDIQIIRHTLRGCFSQKTGLLIQLEDTHLLRITAENNDVFWETTMETLIEDYRSIDGIGIAHRGTTNVSMLRYEKNRKQQTSTRMREDWVIEEVDFNIRGLSVSTFLPPRDLRRDGGGGAEEEDGDSAAYVPRAYSPRTVGGVSMLEAALNRYFECVSDSSSDD